MCRKGATAAISYYLLEFWKPGVFQWVVIVVGCGPAGRRIGAQVDTEARVPVQDVGSSETAKSHP